MFWKKNRKKEEEERNQPEIDVSIDEVRQAIKQCASDMPMGISLRSFVNDDHSINFKLLKGILKGILNGIPKQKFYMSKETFEVFEDAEKARTIDKVQIGVDQYISEKNEIPVMPGDPTFRISYFLIKEYIHHEQPDYPLYIDPNDRLVTHRRPNQ